MERESEKERTKMVVDSLLVLDPHHLSHSSTKTSTRSLSKQGFILLGLNSIRLGREGRLLVRSRSLVLIDLDVELDLSVSLLLDEHALLLLHVDENVVVLLLRLPVCQAQSILDPLKSKDFWEGGGGVCERMGSSSSSELISERGRLLDEDVGGLGDLVGEEVRSV